MKTFYLILIAVVVTCVVFTVFRPIKNQSVNLPNDGVKVQSFLPPEAAPSVTNLSLNGANHRVLIVRSLNKILECEKNTAASTFSPVIERREGKLYINVKSNKAAKELIISGFDTLLIKNSSGTSIGGSAPRNATAADFADAYVRVGIMVDFKPNTAVVNGSSFFFQKGNKVKRIPLGDFAGNGSIIASGYNFCAVVKQKIDPKTNSRFGITSVILADTSTMTIAEIPVPQDLPSSYPVFVLDPKTDCLLAFDLELNWMIAVDLLDSSSAPDAALSNKK